MDRGLSNEDAYDLFCEQTGRDPMLSATEEAWQNLPDWLAHGFFFPDDVVKIEVSPAAYDKLLEELAKPPRVVPELLELFRNARPFAD